MSYQAPICLSDATYPDGAANTTNQQGRDPHSTRGTWFMEYGGAWYHLILQFSNSSAYSFRVRKSIDSGATWATVDEANEPLPNTLSTANRTTCLVQGSKFRVALDHESTSGTSRTYEIRIYTFDAATETWTAGYVAGPNYTDSAGATRFMLCDMCLRGTDELIVLYNQPVSGGPYQYNCFIDIYNTTSATWTTTALAVFDGTGGWLPQDGDTLIWDGTYTHIFSDISNDNSAGYLRHKLHVTLDGSNALGTYQNILTALDPTWVNPVLYFGDPYWFEYGWGYQNLMSLAVHNGKVYAAQAANITQFTNDVSNWYYQHQNVICFECDAGVAVPTFDCKAVVYDSVGAATNPKLFISGGSLLCAYNRDDINYTSTGVINYSTRGASSWSGDTTVYDYSANPPNPPNNLPGTSGGWRVMGISLIPDQSGAPRFALVATLGYWYTQSVWIMLPNPCCCANYAY